MHTRRKISALFCGVFLFCFCANGTYAQQNTATIAPAEKPSDKADALNNKDDRVKLEPIKFEPPRIAQLACPETLGITPFLALTAKAKEGTQYQNVRVGCIDLGSEEALVSEQHQQGLEQAAQYMLASDKFIRLYIDLEDAKIEDEEMLKRFRTKAFAVRKILTDKGVYDKLQANRDGIFPSRFAKKDEITKAQDIKTAKKAPVRRKAKPRDPSRDYAFQVERKDIFVAQGEGEGVYGNDDGGAGFQFIPMQSVYFVHDEHILTKRAKATLLSMVKYILAHPETDRLIIKGHADITGSENYNYRLTDRRALAVRDFVIENGVPEEIVDILSRGEIDPVDEDWTRQGKSRNRRVELFIVQRNAQLDPALTIQ